MSASSRAFYKRLYRILADYEVRAFTTPATTNLRQNSKYGKLLHSAVCLKFRKCEKSKWHTRFTSTCRHGISGVCSGSLVTCMTSWFWRVLFIPAKAFGKSKQQETYQSKDGGRLCSCVLLIFRATRKFILKSLFASVLFANCLCFSDQFSNTLSL